MTLDTHSQAPRGGRRALLYTWLILPLCLTDVRCRHAVSWWLPSIRENCNFPCFLPPSTNNSLQSFFQHFHYTPVLANNHTVLLRQRTSLWRSLAKTQKEEKRQVTQDSDGDGECNECGKVFSFLIIAKGQFTAEWCDCKIVRVNRVNNLVEGIMRMIFPPFVVSFAMSGF